MTQLNIKALIASNEVSSTESARHYICGVYTAITRDSADTPEYRVYVATNGHALVRIKTPINADDNREEMIIPSGIIDDLCKMNKKERAEYVRLERNATAATGYNLIVNMSQIFFVPIGGTFPDWRRVLPSKNEPVARIGIETELLNSMGKSFKLWTGNKKAPLALEFQDAMSSIAISGGNDNNWSGVIMPTRV